MVSLANDVIDSLCELTELDDIDPVFNRKFVKMRVEHAIESYRWDENEWCEKQRKEQDPFVKKLKKTINLCQELKIAILDLPVDDIEFAFHDSGTQLNSGFFEALSELQERLRSAAGYRQPPRSTGGRPRRCDSEDFIGHLVETFYLVDGGRKSGTGCTKYRRLCEFLVICIDEAGVGGAPAIQNFKDSAWKRYVEPAIKSTRAALPKSRKFFEDLHRAFP